MAWHIQIGTSCILLSALVSFNRKGWILGQPHMDVGSGILLFLGLSFALYGILVQRRRDNRTNFEYEIRSRGNADRLKLLFFELNELENRHKEKRVKVSPYLRALSQAVNDVFITMGRPSITEYSGSHESRIHWMDHAAEGLGEDALAR